MSFSEPLVRWQPTFGGSGLRSYSVTPSSTRPLTLASGQGDQRGRISAAPQWRTCFARRGGIARFANAEAVGKSRFVLGLGRKLADSLSAPTRQLSAVVVIRSHKGRNHMLAKDTVDDAELVDRLSLWSGAAGLIPVPLVDIAAVWGVQLHMLRRLSEIYGVPFSENRGKSILTSLAGAVMPATTATTAASVMKGVPIIGTAIGALTMPAVAAGATWLIGKVFIKHFVSGGTLLDFNPPDYREFIKSQKAKVHYPI
jgi:uncharacterized protein (DUF697 family)